MLLNLRINLREAPSYIQQKIKEINDFELKEKLVLEKYGSTMQNLEQYIKDQSLFEKSRALENQLSNEKQKNNSLQNKLSKMQSENFFSSGRLRGT